MGLLFRIGGVELVESGVELLGVLEVSGLLALHGVHGDLVKQCELLSVGIFVGLCGFDALS